MSYIYILTYILLYSENCQIIKNILKIFRFPNDLQILIEVPFDRNDVLVSV